MAELFRGIVAQPGFPREDLVDMNAAVIELMLQNPIEVARSHIAIEQDTLFYSIAHPMLKTVATDAYDKKERGDVINYGIMSYEAVAAFVGARPLPAPIAVFDNNVRWLRESADSETLIDYSHRAYEQFHDEMPRTYQVIEAGARRLYAYYSHYALLGAALARQFELDSTGDIED